ncbi:MAG TPA: endonuclease III [Candidatus Babeliales bacterium]|nr:endonuclease III [Candidatus Babeliales bacterium]
MPSEKKLEDHAISIIKILRTVTRTMPKPAATQIVDQFGRNPYLILISCLLSLRTRDTVSLPASLRLFQVAQTPEEMVALPIHQIEKIIHTVGFYRHKSHTIHDISQTLIKKFASKVPSTEQELRSLKGVGPKTANLVLSEAFQVPAICVDTHVHRISNRLGLVNTTTTEATEKALKKILPKEYWSEWNHLLVMWGQNICVPISPFCSRCAISDLCPKKGVMTSR